MQQGVRRSFALKQLFAVCKTINVYIHIVMRVHLCHNTAIADDKGEWMSRKERQSAMTIEDLMDVKGDLETVDMDKLGELVEQFIDLKKMSKDQIDQINALQEDAMSDPLTGVANQRMLERELMRAVSIARRYARHSALVVIDIDDFKSINDIFGYEVGDEVLMNISNLIRQNVRPTDLVARLDKDEFAVVFNEIRSLEDTEFRATDLVDTLSKTPHIVGGRQVHIEVSMGCHYFGAEDDVASIFEKADADMLERSASVSTKED